MCGISVIINKTGRPVSPDLIKSVNNKVANRGPDDEGYFLNDSFALGHRRLSIIDLTHAGHQPMNYEHFWITFNGEIYNYVELKAELELLGNTFKTDSDTEVLLAAYKQWGVNAFAKLNGMWAFAIYDIEKNEIILCRDHFGIKPLFFTQVGDFFSAGSEVKQFTALESFVPKLNKDIALNFLIRGWLNYSTETFFEGVHELRAGHYIKYDLATHHYDIRQWYNLKEKIVPISATPQEATDKVRELFIESVKIRMRADVNVGSCLSGGIDSSAIVSIIDGQHFANKDFTTVTSCFEDQDFDEQRFSDLVTSQTGFCSIKVYPELDRLLDSDHLDKMVYAHDQPFSSASNYSQLIVFEFARRNNIVVMMDGQGSDEYFLGYGEFVVASLLEFLKTGKFGLFYSLLKNKSIANKSSVFKEFTKYFLMPIYFSLASKAKAIMRRKEYPWLSESWKKRARIESDKFNPNEVNKLSLCELVDSNLPNLLHSEDRNSMFFSIESRLPFLDHRLVEYVIGLPTEYKIGSLYSKNILRDAIGELPSPIKHRNDKMGFVAPTARFLKDNREVVRNELVQIVDKFDFFNLSLVSGFDDFVSGEKMYSEIYFRAIALNRFCEVFKMKLN
jgi:asparagine synthase (glutamine-hydrolysing)